MEKMIYGKLVCDFCGGMDNLSVDEMVEMLGYDSLKELNFEVIGEEDVDDYYNEDNLYEYFYDNYDIYFDDEIEMNGLEILSKKEEGYYKGGCGPFIVYVYKVKGSKEDFDRMCSKWFVVDYDEVDLERMFVEEN